jgi:DNA invertase Pin-like site-specific DNA recombinase
MNTSNNKRVKRSLATSFEQETVNISIPENLVDTVTKYLESLKLTENNVNNDNNDNSSTNSNNTTNTTNITSTNTNYKVKRIISHIYNQTTKTFTFKIQLIDNTEISLHDNNVENEKLIKLYFKTNNINVKTAYCDCRVSTTEQAKMNHVSLDIQESTLVDLALKNNNVERIKVIKMSKSAYHNIPTNLNKISECMNLGDVLLVYRIDRLARNVARSVPWLDSLVERGIFIYSHMDNLSYNDVNDRLKFIQELLVAETESTKLGMRIKESITGRINRGDDKVGGLKYGKKYERRENGSLKVVDNKDELKIIKLIKKNHSRRYKDIMDELNSKKLYKKGKKWTINMVSNIKKTIYN